MTGAPATEPAVRPRRLFFALWPDDAQRQALDQALTETLPSRAGRRLPLANLHVTLVFIGLADAAQQACLERLAAGLTPQAFDLLLDRINWWRQSQVLWLGCAETPPALAQLVADLRAGATACGFGVDARPFRVHMTLMRKVRRRPLPLPGTPPLAWRPDSFALVESVPVPDGVRYDRLASWPLS